MWDVIVLIPDHCLSIYFSRAVSSLGSPSGVSALSYWI